MPFGSEATSRTSDGDTDLSLDLEPPRSHGAARSASWNGVKRGPGDHRPDACTPSRMISDPVHGFGSTAFSEAPHRLCVSNPGRRAGVRVRSRHHLAAWAWARILIDRGVMDLPTKMMRAALFDVAALAGGRHHTPP